MPRFRLAGVVLLAGLTLLPAAAGAHLPSSIQTTVPPGGNATISSPALPPSMTSATVDVAPADGRDEFFNNMNFILSLQSSPGKRLLTCIGLYINVAHGIDETVELQFPENVHPLAVLLLSACLHMAAAIDRAAAQGRASATGSAAALAARCRQAATQIPATFTRVGRNGYTAKIRGSPAKLKQRGRLKVTCKRKGRGLTLKVRPSAKGKTLRSVVGPRLQVGLYNPLEAKGSSRMRLTFRR